MSRAERRFVRIYTDLKEKRPDIWYHESALGTYVLLLAGADMAWPMIPLLPRVARPRDVQLLANAGLIELVDDHGYRCRDFEGARQRQADNGSAAASSRWREPRKPGGRIASAKTRFAVLVRDGHRCRYCGRTAAEVSLDVDHVIPVRDGGTDDLDNLVAACSDCNAGKSGHRLEEFE